MTTAARRPTNLCNCNGSMVHSPGAPGCTQQCAYPCCDHCRHGDPNNRPNDHERPCRSCAVSAATPDAQWVLLERAEAEHYRKMFLEASRQQDRMFWLLCFAVVMALAWMAVAIWALTR